MATGLNTHLRAQLDSIAEYLTDLHSGGILVLDRLDPEAGPITANEQVAFRTLVQLDGDVVTQVARGALASPEFAAAAARHLDHVRETLVGRHARLHRWVTGAGGLGAVATGGLGFAASFGAASNMTTWAKAFDGDSTVLVSACGAVAMAMGAGAWRWIGRTLIPAIVTRVVAARFAARTQANNSSA